MFYIAQSFCVYVLKILLMGIKKSLDVFVIKISKCFTQELDGSRHFSRGESEMEDLFSLPGCKVKKGPCWLARSVRNAAPDHAPR